MTVGPLSPAACISEGRHVWQTIYVNYFFCVNIDTTTRNLHLEILEQVLRFQENLRVRPVFPHKVTEDFVPCHPKRPRNEPSKLICLTQLHDATIIQRRRPSHI